MARWRSLIIVNLLALAPFDEAAAHAAGVLLGKTRTKGIVTASVAVLAIRQRAAVVSDDAEDIRRLLGAARAKLAIPSA